MTDEYTPYVPTLVERNKAFAADFADADLQVEPTRHLVVIACMDSRMDVFALLGLGHGEAHVIRNAGGVVTDDVIRSVCLSQRALGTREIVLIHHTDCGLQKVEETSFRAELYDELGVTPTWATDAFSDPYSDTRQSIRRIQLSPFIRHTEHVSGYVYDVTDGLLHPVESGA